MKGGAGFTSKDNPPTTTPTGHVISSSMMDLQHNIVLSFLCHRGQSCCLLFCRRAVKTPCSASVFICAVPAGCQVQSSGLHCTLSFTKRQVVCLRKITSLILGALLQSGRWWQYHILAKTRKFFTRTGPVTNISLPRNCHESVEALNHWMWLDVHIEKTEHLKSLFFVIAHIQIARVKQLWKLWFPFLGDQVNCLLS